MMMMMEKGRNQRMACQGYLQFQTWGELMNEFVPDERARKGAGVRIGSSSFTGSQSQFPSLCFVLLEPAGRFRPVSGPGLELYAGREMPGRVR